MTIERRPLALAEQILSGHLVRLLRINNDEVRKTAFANVATIDDAEKVRWRMAGTFNEQLVSNLAGRSKIEQRENSVLH